MANIKAEFSQYEPWIRLKIKDFNRLGYNQITSEDLWRYLKQFCWKHEEPAHYHAGVKQVMEINPNNYLDFASLEAQVKVPSLDEMDMNDFF